MAAVRVEDLNAIVALFGDDDAPRTVDRHAEGGLQLPFVRPQWTETELELAVRIEDLHLIAGALIQLMRIPAGVVGDDDALVACRHSARADEILVTPACDAKRVHMTAVEVKYLDSMSVKDHHSAIVV